MAKERLSRSDRAALRGSNKPAYSVPTTPVVPTTPAAPPPPSPIIPVADQNKQEQAYAQALMPYLAGTERTALSATYGVGSPGRIAGSANAPVLNRNYFLGSQRANSALAALEAARTASGGSATDSGFAFLNQSINLLKKYGGEDMENGMSRENYQRFTDEFKALLEQAKTTRVPAFYQNVAQMFLQPTTAEPLMATDKYGFGAASRRLFT